MGWLGSSCGVVLSSHRKSRCQAGALPLGLVNTDDSFSTGVPVGVLEPLPRTQQVFPPKLKHKKLGDSEFNPVAVNYPSARVSVADLEKKFLEEEVLGRMFPLRLSVAKEKFGEDKVRVASMAATTKPDGSVRPLHDGTHSVQVNNAIVYKDQIQCPGPPEVAAAVREALESREAPFAISADIRAAHRLVKIRPSDWGFLACRADSDSQTVWINKCGAFGISSAPYWWAKLFSLVGRFVGHLMSTTWFLHMVYVDDLHGAFTGLRKFHNLWVWVLAFEVVGTPFGYHKFRGGFSVEFVGFQMKYDTKEVGVTIRRGNWLRDWILSAADKRRLFMLGQLLLVPAQWPSCRTSTFLRSSRWSHIWFQQRCQSLSVVNNSVRMRNAQTTRWCLGAARLALGGGFKLSSPSLMPLICLLRERVLNGPPHQQSFLRPWLHWWLLVGRNSAECENPWSFVLLQVLITGAMSFFLGSARQRGGP